MGTGYLIKLIVVIATMSLHATSKEVKKYTVKKVRSGELTINGKGDSPLWKNAEVLSDFTYPWEKDVAPLTTFKALHSSDWLYLLYSVTDPAVHVYVDKNDKREVGASDRVEVFFRIDDRLTPYYGLEIDPTGRVMDYQVSYHRKFNMEWTWPADQLRIKTSLQPHGYIVEVAISKKSLKDLRLLNGNKLEAGLYRGDCTSLVGSEASLRWISWVTPDSETPDFHIPSSFGLFVLEE